jgi:hypothetical protein
MARLQARIRSANVDHPHTWPAELRAAFVDRSGVATALPQGAYRRAPYGRGLVWVDSHARRVWGALLTLYAGEVLEPEHRAEVNDLAEQAIRQARHASN